MKLFLVWKILCTSMRNWWWYETNWWDGTFCTSPRGSNTYISGQYLLAGNIRIATSRTRTKPSQFYGIVGQRCERQIVGLVRLIYIYICIYICMCVCVCVCVYIYIYYICIYMYMYMYIGVDTGHGRGGESMGRERECTRWGFACHLRTVSPRWLRSF